MCLKQCPRLPFQKLVFVILSMCRIALNIQCDNKVNRFIHMNVNVCVWLECFFHYIVITNRITKHYSVYGISLVCLFMSILFTVYCCVFLYLCEDFNSIHFHFILSLHLIFFLASFLYCISAGSL